MTSSAKASRTWSSLGTGNGSGTVPGTDGEETAQGQGGRSGSSRRSPAFVGVGS